MVIFFGPAGAGKTIQGQMMASECNWQWLSVGQLMREENNPEIINIMDTGKLVDSQIVEGVISKKLNQIVDRSKVILDGFPRQLSQAEWLTRNDFDIEMLVVLDVPRDELIRRLRERSRGADDAPEVIEKRLAHYRVEAESVLGYYEKQNTKIIHIDGTGTIEEVHERVAKELKLCQPV